MSSIEPTEEQKQAAACIWRHRHNSDPLRDIAQLLAKREAKLREDLDANIRLRVAAEERTRLLQGLANNARAEADTLQARLREWRGLVDMHMNDANTLRARVAELEAERKKRRDAHASQVQNLCADNDRLYLREAQHLADIKRLRRAVEDRVDIGSDEVEKLLDDTAHYDDAKAAAPECPKCQEGTHPFYDVEQARWLCDRCHHPAGEPFVHVDDDHKNGPCGWSGCGRCGDAEGGEG